MSTRLLVAVAASLALVPAAAAGTTFEAKLAAAVEPIAGKPVSVTCDTDWAAAVQAAGVRADAGGFAIVGGDTAHVMPSLCDAIARAEAMPLSCTVTHLVMRRQRVGGVTYRWQTSVASAARCPDGYFTAAAWVAVAAVWTLAHEATHLSGVADEAAADCRSMQHVEQVAVALGFDPQVARLMGSIAWSLYQTWPTVKPGYWSPDCRDGGALDVHPESGVWP
jgi:hypothetical protein